MVWFFTSVSLTMLEPLMVWITTNCGKLFKRWEYQIPLPVSWETCMQDKKKQNQTWKKGGSSRVVTRASPQFLAWSPKLWHILRATSGSAEAGYHLLLGGGSAKGLPDTPRGRSQPLGKVTVDKDSEHPATPSQQISFRMAAAAVRPGCLPLLGIPQRWLQPSWTHFPDTPAGPLSRLLAACWLTPSGQWRFKCSMKMSNGPARAPGMSSSYVEELKSTPLLVRAWQNIVPWRKEWQATSVFLPWEPHEQYERAKGYDTERWIPPPPGQ